MDPFWIGIIGLTAMLVLIALGIPIAISLLATGAIGLIVMGGNVFAETQLVFNLWDEGTNFALTAIPLYLLMGQLVFRTGLATDLYDCIYKWVGRMPGGLAIAWPGGRTEIKKDGAEKKFVRAVEQITYSGPLAAKNGQRALYVTERGGIGINVGGLCIVKSLREWHELAAVQVRQQMEEARYKEAQAFYLKHSQTGTPN